MKSFQRVRVPSGWLLAILIVCLWVAANVVGLVYSKRWQRTRLESTHELQLGILDKYFPETLSATDAAGNEHQFGFRIHEPHFKGDEKLPVVLFLHGAGERGNDNARQLRGLPTVLVSEEYQKDYPCFIIAPQCPDRADWISFRTAFPFSEDSKAGDILIRFVESVLQHPQADRDRVYLMGYSMGSFGSWLLVADFPEYFAATVPISGGGPVKLAASLVDAPIWTVHGDQDNICPVEDTRALVAAIQNHGGAPRYSELKGVEHNAWYPAICQSSEVLNWLFLQKRGSK